ncbi:catalase-like domain-containing protein [Suillus lakei]|nr:catalase-like domain-containing protein [Suillus lakei]
MYFSGFAALLSLGAATAVAHAGQAKRDASQPYFDIYQGPNEQILSSMILPLNSTTPCLGERPFHVQIPQPIHVRQARTTGPLLISSTNLIEQLAHFVRERVPERTVHAKGAGAHGWFEVTTPVAANYSMATVFSEVGKRTQLLPDFLQLQVMGNADTVRDLRGLGFKLRTEDGILDWSS